jgi:hypothetical protein
MKPDRDALNQLRDEATDRFFGSGGVVGVGIGPNDRLVILLSKPDPRQQQAIRGWASGDGRCDRYRRTHRGLERPRIANVRVSMAPLRGWFTSWRAKPPSRGAPIAASADQGNVGALVAPESLRTFGGGAVAITVIWSGIERAFALPHLLWLGWR